MGLSKIDFNWNIMVRIKIFNCPHVGLAKGLDLVITWKYYKVVMHVLLPKSGYCKFLVGISCVFYVSIAIFKSLVFV